eukprot:2706511-Lingulodinium_polyedra.AAC.1
MGHGVSDPRVRAREFAREHRPPLLEMDYSYLKADETPTEDEAEAAGTILSFWDESTQFGVAFALASKTSEWRYLMATMR